MSVTILTDEQDVRKKTDAINVNTRVVLLKYSMLKIFWLIVKSYLIKIKKYFINK